MWPMGLLFYRAPAALYVNLWPEKKERISRFRQSLRALPADWGGGG